MQIHLIVWSTGMNSSRICFLGFAFLLGFMFVTHDMIQCAKMWQQIHLHSHMIHICTGLTNALSHGFT